MDVGHFKVNTVQFGVDLAHFKAKLVMLKVSLSNLVTLKLTW